MISNLYAQPTEMWIAVVNGEPVRADDDEVVVVFDVRYDLGMSGRPDMPEGHVDYWDADEATQARMDAFDEATDAYEEAVGAALIAAGERVAPWATFKLGYVGDAAGPSHFHTSAAADRGDDGIEFALYELAWDGARDEVEALERALCAEFADLGVKVR